MSESSLRERSRKARSWDNRSRLSMAVRLAIAKSRATSAASLVSAWSSGEPHCHLKPPGPWGPKNPCPPKKRGPRGPPQSCSIQGGVQPSPQSPRYPCRLPNLPNIVDCSPFGSLLFCNMDTIYRFYPIYDRVNWRVAEKIVSLSARLPETNENRRLIIGASKFKRYRYFRV